MIMIEAYCRIKPGMEGKMLALLGPVHEATRKEQGCVAYSHYPSADDPGEMFIFEKWESAEAFDAHRETEHHKTFVRERRPLLVENSYTITIWQSEEDIEYTRRIREYAKKAMN